MSNGDTNYTTGLSVTFSFKSTASPAPYDMTGCAGSITKQQGNPITFSDWSAENLGTPDPNGATFALAVTDLDYAAQNNATGIANWAVTFIPRAGTTMSSPTTNNKNTIAGSGYISNSNGTFTLFSGTTNAIKNTGDWDWSLMIQITLPNNVVKCFASDPEMEVGT